MEARSNIQLMLSQGAFHGYGLDIPDTTRAPARRPQRTSGDIRQAGKEEQRCPRGHV